MASLFFICPTDFIECTINMKYNGKNYFYNSLGNSVIFDDVLVGQTKQLIQKHNITNIVFVLSDSNQILSDSINQKSFANVKGLNSFYGYLSHKILGVGVYDTDIDRQVVLSYHLNFKIIELEKHLKNIFPWKITIDGKIYNKEQNLMKDIYPQLVCEGVHSFN